MALTPTTARRRAHQETTPSAPLRPVLRAVGAAVTAAVRTEPFQRDPAMVARIMPCVELVQRYFGTEVHGWSHVPTHGPFLIVGNHSGGAMPNDFWFIFGKWVKERGPEAPLYALTYDLLFATPVVNTLLRKLGAIPANAANARRALGAGAPVLVFPGGDHEVFRPWSERNRIDFGGRTGFIKLALTTRVPVVPVTIHGAHESTFTVTRGRRLAKWLGLNALHIGVLPLVWNVPLGITPAYVPSLPLPSKVTIQFGAPLDWSRFYRQADNPEVQRHCYEEITARMQATLDRLARARPSPILSRLDELRPARLFHLPSLWAAAPRRRTPRHRL